MTATSRSTTEVPRRRRAMGGVPPAGPPFGDTGRDGTTGRDERRTRSCPGGSGRCGPSMHTRVGMRTTRFLVLALLAVAGASACGASPPKSTAPKQKRLIERGAEVIVEDGVLVLTDGSETIGLTVHFTVDSAALDEQAEKVLVLLSNFLSAREDMVVEVNGHSDERGDEGHNLALSQRRAAVVARYLAEQGVDRSRLHAQGFGDTEPVVEGEGETTWRRNRRVEFSVRK